jgi:hypothetical protein
MPLCIFTIVARNYIPLALTLADSVARNHPEADLRIFVVDGTADLPASTQHRLCSLDELLNASFDELRFKYNITEFCTSVKPLLFQRLFAETQAEVIYYLDPDTWLFGRLDPIHQAAPLASVFLTPHLLHCRPELDHAYPEYKHLWEGIFNLGFCAIRRSPQSSVFLAWWDKRLRDYCYADHFDGLHTDQKWMDYAPAYLGDALHIVRQQGVNVAHWNLDERKIEAAPDGLAVNGEPLRLFHFSGFDFKGQQLTRHAEPERQQRYLGAAVLDLAARYRQAVHANGFDAFIGLPYRFNHFDNGRSVTALHRRLYRGLGGARWHSAPFDSKGQLYLLLRQRGLLDDSPAALKGHAAATLPGLGRLTTVAQRLLSAFLRLFGPRRYAYLLKFFNKYARPESHVFLLHPGAIGQPGASDPKSER